MRFEWDENKRQANLAKQGTDFADALEMFSAPMLIGSDRRREYGEPRFIGSGHIQGRLMVVAFTRRGETIRIISLRKANKREKKRFEAEIRNRLGSH